ncbi:MAG: NAD-dependent epimerase/dehydratase family protein [Methylobacteriaceae bacterium]|nr:NAD-dependent epimerase/dehydratase family protein [Methylobacteriaceae bacterium]
MRIFVTGAAGFIGFHLCRRLLDEGHVVDGFDGLTRFYDQGLKAERRALLEARNGFRLHVGMLENEGALAAALAAAKPEVVIHLAAQAGVRYSLESPRAYVGSNIVGTFNLLEALRENPPGHLLIASTSSLYGAGRHIPFVEHQHTDQPLTLYAASKKATEVMAHAHAHLWRLPTTVFRFFTVYGPWGRPDMAPLKFVNAIEAGRPIDIYNNGAMRRDFTYISDLVEAIVRLIQCVPRPAEEDVSDEPALSPVAPFRIVNIGRGAPVNLLDFIDEIERQLGKRAIRNYLPMQKGDVPVTFADCHLLERLTGYRPQTGIQEGVAALVDWYRSHGPLQPA